MGESLWVGMQIDERRDIEVQAYRSTLVLKYRNKRQINCSFLHQACLLKFVPLLSMSLLFKTHIRFFFSYYYIVLHLLIHFVDLDILVLFFYIWILKLTPVLTKLVLVPHDNQVFDITSLLIFTPHELDYLLCGRRELWEVIFSYLCIYALRDVIGTSFVECDGYTLIFNFCRLIHLLII